MPLSMPLSMPLNMPLTWHALRRAGPLEPPAPVKTEALERSPGPLESMTFVKLERWSAFLARWNHQPL